MAATSAITPPNFLGIDRRIAYANKKYHSGLICVGVTIGLAFFKFSVSGIRNNVIVIIIQNTNAAGHESFTLK